MVGRFDGRQQTTAALLLREADRKIALLRRVVGCFMAKAQQIEGKENPRYTVTSLSLKD